MPAITAARALRCGATEADRAVASGNLTTNGAAEVSSIRPESKSPSAAWTDLAPARTFGRLLADPRWPVASAGYRFQDNGRHLDAYEHVSVGDSLAFARGPIEIGGRAFELEVGGQASVFSIFDPNNEQSFIEIDFVTGAFVALRSGPSALMLRAWHISGHIGDEFLLDPRYGVDDRTPYKFEALGLIASYDLPAGLRAYAGPDLLFGVNPSDFGRVILRSGLEWRSPDKFVNVARPVAAVDVQAVEGLDFNPDLSLRAGLSFDRSPRGPALQVLGEFYAGRDPNGQFFDDRVTYAGIGLTSTSDESGSLARGPGSCVATQRSSPISSHAWHTQRHGLNGAPMTIDLNCARALAKLVHMRSTHPLATLVVLALPLLAAGRGADEPRELLTTVPPAQSAPELQRQLEAGGDEIENARFALGIAQTLAAIENLGRGMYELGPRRDTLVSGLPILRIPVPDNPNPEEATLADVERLLQGFVADLSIARKTLEATAGDVRLSLPVTRLALDFDGDGQTGEGESLGDVLFALRMVNPRPTPATDEFFVVDFDAADVQWLIAYTHLLSGFAQLALAHDASNLFDHAGHLIFKRATTRFDFLQGRTGFNINMESISDIAAFVHLLKFPVREPARMEAARQHFLAAIKGSRRQFELARAETDNGREWIPNAQQKSAFEGIRVTDDVIEAWLLFLDDAQAVLEGERLIPFWRTDDGLGVNLRRAFAEQREMDVVLWFQGTAAVPYLQRAKSLSE